MQKKAISLEQVMAALQRIKGMAIRGTKGFGTGVGAGLGDIADVARGKNKLKNVLSPSVTAHGSDSSRLLKHHPVGRAGEWGSRIGHAAGVSAPVTVPAGGLAALLSGGDDKTAVYKQGFVDKCAAMGVNPKALVKLAQEEPTRLGSYAASVVPFGALGYGAYKGGPGHRFQGAARGIGGDTLGTLGGAGAGGLAGVGVGGLIGLLAQLLSRGRIKAAPELAGGLGAVGGLGGMLYGGGAGIHSALQGSSRK